MEFSLIYVTVLGVSLLGSLFVIITNLQDASKEVHRLDFRVVGMQLVVLLAWMITLSHALKAATPEETILNAAVFVFSIVIGVLAIQSIIKEQKASDLLQKLIKQMAYYNDQLEKLDEQKTEFVSIASHQLRSPASAITGYASMMLEKDYGELTEEQKEIVKIIFESSVKLNGIINELLDTTRLEQGKLQYKVSDFDLISVIEESVKQYKPLAEEKGLEIKQNFDTNYGATIKADKVKIGQAVSNIIENAIKYTKEGGIEISADKKDGRILISVKDTGIGISKKEQEEIFIKFSRAENAEDLNVVGSGLGLFIAKEIVVNNGGNIWVESDGIDKGSTFYIEFKLV